MIREGTTKMSFDLTSQRSGGAFAAPNFQLDDLPVDVFDVDGGGLTVESLTGGHGMTETGASSFCAPCTTSCWEQ
jgi:hypothetical protein